MENRMPRLNLAPACTAAVLLAALTLTTSANAELITWTNAGGDGLWSNAANWNLGRQPNSADAVIINTPGSEQVLVKIGAACNSLVSSHQVQIQAGTGQMQHITASAAID